MAIFKLSSILKKLERFGSFNCIFENNSLKALFGQNIKQLKILKLSPDSRYLQKLALNSEVVHSDLLKSGFFPNEDKSQWEPIQIIIWLGAILNTIDGSIKAIDERIAKLSRDLENWSIH